MFGTKSQSQPRVVDVICGMKIDPATAAATREHDGTTFYFCSNGCAKEFDSDPQRHGQS
jgi:Cu+-exporting ATPase